MLQMKRYKYCFYLSSIHIYIIEKIEPKKKGETNRLNLLLLKGQGQKFELIYPDLLLINNNIFTIGLKNKNYYN